MVEINDKELKKFLKLVRKAYPNEFCGFLLGVELVTKTCADKIYIPQEQEKYATPGEIILPEYWWIEAKELAKELKLEVVGFIHSHPDYKDTSMSEQDLGMTNLLKGFFKCSDPVMGIVGVYKAGQGKRLRTKVGLWPMFNKHKVCLK